jgi:hypothetical protein
MGQYLRHALSEGWHARVCLRVVRVAGVVGECARACAIGGCPVDERQPLALAKRNQAGWRDLAPRIDPDQIAGKAAHDQQPHRRHDASRWNVWLKRPRERKLDRHELRVGGLEVDGEAWQQPGGLVELVAEGAPQPQVVLDMLSERGHRAAPGQGWATCRTRGRSTFA